MPPLLPLKGGRFAPLQLSAIFCKELSASLSQNAEPTHPQQCIPRVSALSLHQTHPYVTEAAIYVQDRCFCISAGGRGLSRDSCHHTSPKKSSKCATTTSSELAACNLPYLTTSCTLPPNVTFPPRLEKSYWKNPGWILLYDALQRAKFTSHKPACITNASPSTTPRSCLIADENLGFPTPSLPGWCLSCIFQPSRSEWVVRNVL